MEEFMQDFGNIVWFTKRENEGLKVTKMRRTYVSILIRNWCRLAAIRHYYKYVFVFVVCNDGTCDIIFDR